MWSIGLVVIKYIRFEYYFYILMLSVFLTLVRVFDPYWYMLLSPLYLSSSLFCIRTHRQTDRRTDGHCYKQIKGLWRF